MTFKSTVRLAILMALLTVAASSASAQDAGIPSGVEAVTLIRSDAQRARLAVENDLRTPVPQSLQSTPPAQTLRTPIMIERPNLDSAVKETSPQPELHSVATTGNPVYDELVKKSAARNGVDPNLVMAVMRQESGFNPRAQSYKGATGLMQLMPATARRFGVVNIYDPAQNIEGGTKYLRFLLDTFNGNVELALAGYNAGENAVVNSGYQIPRYRETQNYVKSISAKYGKSKSARVQVAASGPVAPAAITFSGGSSTRLSNNY